VRDGASVFYVARVASPQLISYQAPLGVPSPLHCTASGKLFLAFMDEAAALDTVLAGRLDRFTDKTIVDRRAVLEHLPTVRRQGHALSVGEYNAELFGVAAPVRNSAGAVIASIGLGGPLTRCKGRIRELAAAARHTAAAVSAEVERAHDNVSITVSVASGGPEDGQRKRRTGTR
jgi:DNA-binding IclR family transcriptional regulator